MAAFSRVLNIELKNDCYCKLVSSKATVESSHKCGQPGINTQIHYTKN